jgi:hypothetical protein
MKPLVLLLLVVAASLPAKADYVDPCPVDGALWNDGRTINCTATAPRNVDQTPGTIEKFSLTADVLSPESTVTINTSTGKVIDADVYLSAISLQFFYILKQGVNGVLLMSNAPGGGSGAWIDLRMDTDSLVGYNGGAFTATEGPGLPSVAGSLTPVPEAASWMLLLVGLLTLMGACRTCARCPRVQ